MKIYSLQADLCKALAHPVRLQVLDLISEKEYTVEDLAKLTGSGQSNLSQHLAALRQQKLVVPRRSGMNVYYGLSNPKISDACSLIKKLLVELLDDEHSVVKKLEA
jgi:DNA-binding transcriptional ArsR family regulator